MDKVNICDHLLIYPNHILNSNYDIQRVNVCDMTENGIENQKDNESDWCQYFKLWKRVVDAYIQIQFRKYELKSWTVEYN